MLALVLLMVLMLACVPFMNADTTAMVHVTRFEIVSHGMTVGHGRIMRTPTLRDGQPCMETRQLIESKVNLLFFKYALKTDELWVSDAGGLVAYKYDGIENGRPKRVSGELDDGLFRFEIIEAAQKSAWSTPRTAFELSANSQPGQALADGAVTNVLVLDPCACSVTQCAYRGTGMAKLTVGQRQIMCHTITIERPGANIRRWYITDEFGPLILREDGREERGPYSRRAISMDLEPQVAE